MAQNGLVLTNENCVGCNKCISVCSCVGATVAHRTEDGGNIIQVDGNKCVACGACFDACEHNAREYVDDTEVFFEDLKKGERISLLLDPAFLANYPKEYASVLGGLKQMGVNRILSISFGADITTWAYLNYVQKNNFMGGISQPCPAVVGYIERYIPKLIPKLFPVQSPMMCGAIYARKHMGITDKLAFISPCIAKKMEMESERGKGLVSYNVTFDHLMEYVRTHNIKGPSAKDMGVGGAALATVLSQLLSFVMLCIGTRKGGNIRIHIRNFKPTPAAVYEIIRGGFPSLCRQGLASVSGIFLNHMAGGYGGIYGDAAIAAMSIVTRVTMFANSALIGFGQGFQPVCAMNYGAGKYDRVREGFLFCVKYAFVFLIVTAVAGIALAEPLIMIFRKDDADVIRIGTLALRMHCLAFPLSAWIVICNMMLQSIGRAMKASVVAAARQGLFFIPLIFILPYFFGLFGVQVCQMVSDICSFALALPIGLSELKRLKSEKE